MPPAHHNDIRAAVKAKAWIWKATLGTGAQLRWIVAARATSAPPIVPHQRHISPISAFADRVERLFENADV